MPGVRGGVPGEREPRGEAEAEHEGGPQQHRLLGQPGEVEQRRHEREAERHRDERGAELRPVRERRQVAVEECSERQLERVLGPQQEGGEPDLERSDRADPRHPVEAPLGSRRKRAAHDEQPEADPADEQREREEVEPAHDVLGRRRSLRADRVGHRRCRIAQAERRDAGDDVSVAREGAPADRVRADRQRLRQRCDDLAHRLDRPRRAGDVLARGVEDDDRAGDCVDRLVEREHDARRQLLEPLLERRGLVQKRRVRERDRREGEGRECGGREGDGSHRCCTPA